MISFPRVQRWLVSTGVAGALALSWPVCAYPPAPYHVIYGLVRDEYGVPLSLADAQIIFVPVDGVPSSGSIVPDLDHGVNYRLDLAMDSGTAPDRYKITALNPQVPFRIQVRIGARIYLPIEMAANSANRLGKPGESTRIDLTLGEDADHDGLPDAWQALLKRKLGPGAKTGPDDDADGDGISNLKEYLAGTYAWEPPEGFRLTLVPNPDGVPLLEFMVVGPRIYTVYSSSDLGTWSALRFNIPADGAAATNLANFAAAGVRTLRVEPVLPPGTSATNQFFRVKSQLP